MPSRTTCFVQPCPTCGRRLRVCVEYLGRDIQCRHCHAIFTACDPETNPCCRDPQGMWLQRVNALLAPVDSLHQSTH
jgi:hypothetical protein